jgi:hypothetical protein
MNERLKELTDEAGLFWQFSPAYEKCLERFAELVRADEREACAKLCDDLAGQVGNKNFIAVD